MGDCARPRGSFYPVRVSDLAIFDYGDCENSEERYFRLLKRLWQLRTSQEAKKLECRRCGLPFVSVSVRSVTLD